MVAEAANVLARLGLVTAYGHVSARAGEVMLITPAADLAEVTASQVIAVPLTLVQRWARRRRLLSGLLRHGRGLLPAWRPGALRGRMRHR